MSRYWFERAAKNDLLRINGPLGTFFLRDVDGFDLVFLATGTGIAPVKAMLEALAQPGCSFRPNSITVLWGARTAGDLYWDPRVSGCSLQYVPVLSRSAAGWTGACGYVQDVLLKERAQYRADDRIRVRLGCDDPQREDGIEHSRIAA